MNPSPARSSRCRWRVPPMGHAAGAGARWPAARRPTGPPSATPSDARPAGWNEKRRLRDCLGGWRARARSAARMPPCRDARAAAHAGQPLSAPATALRPGDIRGATVRHGHNRDRQHLPTAADVDAAAARLAGVALRTPLINSPVLDAAVGARVFLKAETLQRTGSFKFRGAYNKLSSIPQDRRAGGVVAYSSGNHAQGVAAAAQAPRHAGGDRDAVGRAAAQARAHRRARRRGRALRPRPRGPRRDRARHRATSAAPCWCRRSTIRW